MIATQYTAGSAANWSLIPEHMREGVDLWIKEGTPFVGDFLEAFLCNDLRRTVEYADGTNRERIADYVKFFFNYAPVGSWGSKANFNTWVSHNGLRGRHAYLERLDAEQRAADERADAEQD